MTSASPRRRAFTFGLGALLVLGAFGALIAWRKHHHEAGAILGGLGAAVFALALAWPRGALAVRSGWMAFATALGWVNSRILLGVIFFLLLTPLALIKRLVGGSSLDFAPRKGDGATSYWRDREARHDPKHYEHPY